MADDIISIGEVPLTTQERILIDQIEGEIDQLNKEANECFKEFDKATTEEGQEEWLRRAEAKSRAIAARATVKADTISRAADRLKPNR